MLSKEQVNHIKRTVRTRRLKSFMLENELIDFVSCSVEDQLLAGESFDDALASVLRELSVEDIAKAQKTTVNLRKPNLIDMLQNYLKIAYRNFFKYKVNTAINVFGLLLGLSTSIIIGLYLKHEFSFDNMHPDIEQLYRVNSISYMRETPTHIDAVSPKLRDIALAEIPEITHASDLYFMFYNKPLKRGEESFFNLRFGAVQSDFFEMFYLPVIRGKVESLYASPNGVFLSESLAERVFGEEDPIGQVLTLAADNGDHELEVRGIFQSMPQNSHFQADRWSNFDMLTSMESNHLMTENNYSWSSIQNSMYVKLAPGTDEQTVNDKLNELLKSNMEGEPWYEHYLQPVRDIHLNQRGTEIGHEGNTDQLYLFSAIAIMILIIACINYVNLTTAQAAVRLKEVGIRKVIGARRRQFILQFLTEAALISFFSMALSLVLVKMVLPTLNSTFSLHLSFSLSQDITTLLSFMGIMLMVSLLCGTYPGFYLSRLQPNQLLKSGQAVKSGGGLFRKVLVILQYATSITLIIATLVITDQLNFLARRELGFDKEQVVYVKIGYSLSQKYGETFFNEAKSIPGVQYASLTGNTLGQGSMSGNGVLVGDGSKEDSEIHNVLPVDFEYQKTLGLELKEGRWFSEEYGADRTTGFIVNEALVNHFGLDNPIGMRLKRNSQEGTIVGVVKDFHYKSMKYTIEPLVIHMAPRDKFGYWNMAVRMAPGTITETLDKLRASWESIIPDYPFDYTFLDEEINNFYQSERDFANMFRVFSLLAIVVSCLGLIGLISFSTRRRSKEIGVRKVLGASVSVILGLISKDMIRLILIGAILAIPAAYFFMDEWLQNFEYRTGLSWWTFAVALVMTMVISWLSVSYISLKAARANPVDSLRTE